MLAREAPDRTCSTSSGASGRSELEPAQIANGAVELLGEVSKSKITGEEERYSHIDLVDFEANVDGAASAFDSVRPISSPPGTPRSPDEIGSRFAAVDAALGPYRRGASSSPTRR